jgi:hypothetical protein
MIDRVTPIRLDATKAEDVAAAAAACGDVQIIVNMLSVLSWYVYPFNGTYCMTKHAALSSGPKTPPSQVARKTIEGILGGLDHVLADERAESIWMASRQDPARLHAEVQTPSCMDERIGQHTLQSPYANSHSRPPAASGRSRALCPVASAIALATAADVGPCDVSPVPRNGSPGRPIRCTATCCGTSEKRIIG